MHATCKDLKNLYTLYLFIGYMYINFGTVFSTSKEICFKSARLAKLKYWSISENDDKLLG